MNFNIDEMEDNVVYAIAVAKEKHNVKEDFSIHGDLPTNEEEYKNERKEKLLDDSFTKIKAKKDPNKPRRPLSSYTIFCNDIRDDLKKTNPKLSFGEMNKTLGQKWKELDDKQKEMLQNKMEIFPKTVYKEKIVYKEKPIKTKKSKPKLNTRDDY